MQRKLKVLMVCPQFRPILGGYERSAERLCAALAKRGHEVTVITERRNRAWKSLEQVGGYQVRRLSCWYVPRIHMITSLANVAAFLLLRGRYYDVVHVHQYGKTSALTVALCKLLRRPVVQKITNTRDRGIKMVLGNEPWILRRLLLSLHRQTEAYVATSRAALEEVADFGIDRKRIVIIPNGLDTDDFFPVSPDGKVAAKSRLGLQKPLMVLFCGRLVESKNPRGLLHAWSRISQKVPDAVLCYVGTGYLEAELRQQVLSCGLKDSVIFAGEEENVLHWYQAADLFVLPSHFEGLCNSLLEAVSCGLPVVSTKVSGGTDLFRLGDVGELVELNNSKDLATAIISLLRNPARMKRCGALARAIAVYQFDIKKVAQQMEGVYRSLVNSACLYPSL